MYTVRDNIVGEILEFYHYSPALLEAERRCSNYKRVDEIDAGLITKGDDLIICNKSEL